MPTAMPSIMASIEVLPFMSNTEPSAVMAARLTPTPSSAVTSGRPAAASEPKVMTRMSPASAKPMISGVLLSPATGRVSPVPS